MGTQIGQLPIPRTGAVPNDLIALIIREDVLEFPVSVCSDGFWVPFCAHTSQRFIPSQGPTI